MSQQQPNRASQRPSDTVMVSRSSESQVAAADADAGRQVRWPAAEYTLAVTPVAIPALSTTARCEATLLFADLFGYSAFTEERELEQVAATIGEIKRQAVRIVHSHGGIVNQFVGDEVMAIFGFPKGRDDAPRRAVEAALELHAFVRSSNLRQWLGAERQLQLHSGIDTGMVLISTRDVRNGLFELTGSAVIRAARLRSAAAADELLVSQRVHERIAPFFAMEQQQAQHLKGSPERAQLYRVLRQHTPAAPLPRGRPARVLPARSELSQLQRFWADRTAQRGGLVIIQGAAGSGKTRLLQSFAAQLAPENVVVWSTSGRSQAAEPFAALAHMTTAGPTGADAVSGTAAQPAGCSAIARMATSGPAGADAVSGRAARAALQTEATSAANGSGLHDSATRTAEPGQRLPPSACTKTSAGGRVAAAECAADSGGSVWSWCEVLQQLDGRERGRTQLVREKHDRNRFVRAVTSLVCQRVEASTAQHVFVVDDLQWVDASSLDVLTQLASRLCPQGAVFVCAIRDDAAHAGVLERLLGVVPDDLATQLKLGPLSTEDATELVAEHLGLAQLSGSQLIERLAVLGDGTPLSLLELVHALLEDKYLHAHNGVLRLDSAWLDNLPITASARGLIERRIRALSPEAAKLLRALAVMREGCDRACLLRATRMHERRAQQALEEAARARLIELDHAGQPRFAHDMIWEVLLLGMTASEQRYWHGRAAQALRATRDLDAQQQFTLARHCAAGTLEDDPAGSFEVLRSAARLALGAHDDALALSFLEPAARAAELGKLPIDNEFHVELAETAFRIGELQIAAQAFEAAAAHLAPGFERAHLVGRQAWIQHFHASGSPVEMLERALRECGQSVPTDNGAALLEAAGTQLRRFLGRATRSSQRQLEVLCGLYIGLCRVYLDSGEIARTLAAVTQLAALSDQLQECRVRAQADAMVGIVLGLLGMKGLKSASVRSRARFERSREAALRLQDPIALAYYHQINQVLASLRGDFDEAERHAHECVVVRGQYMELTELCLVCFGQYAVELYRGRMDHALAWAFRAVERVQQYGHAPAVFSLIEDAVCGVFVNRGQQDEVVRFKSRLRFVRRSELGSGGLYYLATFLSRAPYLSGAELANPAFEALVAEFAALRLDPRTLPTGVAAYFVQVAHVRVTQCLRASGVERRTYVLKLRAALADVEATARVPAMHGHVKLLKGALFWFNGDQLAAERMLTEAESLARVFGLPWVSCSAARVRAHMLRAQGNEQAALDQARIAALHASQYGQKSNLRLIRDEFVLLDEPQSASETL